MLYTSSGDDSQQFVHKAKHILFSQFGVQDLDRRSPDLDVIKLLLDDLMLLVTRGQPHVAAVAECE